LFASACAAGILAEFAEISIMRMILFAFIAASLVSLMSCGQKGPLTVEHRAPGQLTITG
jgi:hypothetical protein